MGKKGELWDDSALIKAFDDSVSRYKMMHGMSEEKSIRETFPPIEPNNGSTELLSTAEIAQYVGNPSVVETTPKIGETADIIQIKKAVGSLKLEDCNVIPTNEISAANSDSPVKPMVTSDHIRNKNEATCSNDAEEEYNMLLSKYYEVESQRQQILHQLYQNSRWIEECATSTAPTAEEYQASVPQHYNTAVCYCPYGCQNWIVPCKPSYPGGNHVDQCSADIPEKGSQNGGSEKQLGMGIGHISESNSHTELDVVFNAWYSAGYYTGKYLAEQSSVKRQHDDQEGV